ncbi:MAG: dimethyl sulfoxide reductase anchor subunit [Planctomycetaceae bacterium]|nr:dimethyl sulfoxide reductase anchor subunit [Planctomycetaceae bacterium]
MPLAEPPRPRLDEILSAPSEQPVSLVESLLVQQQELSVVAHFAQRHDAHEFQPAQARYYRDLIPLSAPADDEQYGFTVDLDACSGCKACVTACHSLNGLDDDETFRDVGLLMGRDGRGEHVLQHVTTACHHCLEPACLHGCPTRAYDKDPVTGIVRHLDDQCIGCQYCTLMCPYDVPKYNPAKGIVRKCDMCRQRLDDGEAPACVQACPNQAIRIELVSHESAHSRARAGSFLPTAPDPRVTIPTTRFVSGREQLRDVAPPEEELRPGHAHMPLVLMLVLTQMSIGLFVFSPLAAGRVLVVVAAIIGLAGLAIALLHLGRPQIAYRAWLGWRTSWMSREIIAFAVWSHFAGSFVAATVLSAEPAVRVLLWGLTAITGALAIVCSAMTYVATRRAFWSAGRTIPRFALTAIILGSAGIAAVLAQASQHPPPVLVGLLVAVVAVRLMCDAPTYRIHDGEATELDRSAELLTRKLSGWNHLQVTIAIVAGIFMPLCWFGLPQLAPVLALPSAVLLVAAEVVQRALFFAAVSPPRMPGVRHA